LTTLAAADLTALCVCCPACCSARSGTIADAAAALWYLLDLKNRYDLNLVATQNSWGGGGFSQVRL
jgi:hypothetical protein